MNAWDVLIFCGCALVVASGPCGSYPSAAPSEIEGKEHLVVRAPDGTLVATATGGPHGVDIDGALDRVLRIPGGRLTLTHNHPASVSLSGEDLGQLAKPGVETIEAIGADGSVYCATAGPLYDPDHFQDVVYPAASREIDRQLRVSLARTSRTDIDTQFSHLVALALDKARVIHYRAALSSSRAVMYERNQIAFGHATEAVAAVVRRVLSPDRIHSLDR